MQPLWVAAVPLARVQVRVTTPAALAMVKASPLVAVATTV